MNKQDDNGPIDYVFNIKDVIEDIRKEDPIPFLWSGIKVGSFGYIFGPSKSGKTIICENLALSLATQQKEYLGYDLLEGKHEVLFISMEEHVRNRTERNAMQISAMNLAETSNINLKVVRENFPRYFTSIKELQFLKKEIIRSKASVVFIDSLTRLSAGDIEQSRYARDISLHLREMTYELGITMAVIHHTPKLGKRPISIDSLAGSRVLAQDADFMIGINKTPKGKRYIKEVAFRYKQENEEVLPFLINENCWITVANSSSERQLLKKPDLRKDDSNLKYLKGIIYEFSESNNTQSFSSGDIEKLVESKMDRSTFYDKLNILVDSGEITKIRKGVYQNNNISHT